MNNGTILVNTGVGLGSLRAEQLPSLPLQCPLLLASFDAAIPIAGLPLTIGLITGYFSEAASDSEERYDYWSIAGRIAYHLAFNVPRLDTYILLTLGAAIAYHQDGNKHGIPWIGVGAGGRYFFHPNIGAFLELGLDAVQCVSLGVSFKI